MNDTIAAISTAFGEGAIAVLRMSGPDAMKIAAAVFRGRRAVDQFPTRMQQLGGIFDGERKLDDVMLAVHRAPHSYTGEDVVEISGHGGVLVTRRVLELLLSRGARSANPGEFTQRAYLHGKMDLTQAEAVMDLISAQTDLALRAANDQLEGRLGRRIRGISDALVELLAHIEASIDFPDEDVVPETGEALRARLDAVRREMRALLETGTQGRVLREGVRTVICGAPNVGKSSLLNLLLGYERAIVSTRPGTTRDVIEEVVSLRGIPLRLIDTAGLRESEDEVEQEGMARTRRQLQRADLVLRVVDASQPPLPREAGFFHDAPSFAEAKICGDASGCCTILVLNKIDLGQHENWSAHDGARISCLTGSGIPELEEAVITRITGGEASRRDWSVAINARHKVCLENALKCADAARQTLEDVLSPEFVAEELRGALEAIGEVIGRVETEEVLTKIFSTFCIGK